MITNQRSCQIGGFQKCEMDFATSVISVVLILFYFFTGLVPRCLQRSERTSLGADTPQLAAGSFMCARRAHVLTGESPESTRQWEGYSRTSRALPRGRV